MHWFIKQFKSKFAYNVFINDRLASLSLVIILNIGITFVTWEIYSFLGIYNWMFAYLCDFIMKKKNRTTFFLSFNTRGQNLNHLPCNFTGRFCFSLFLINTGNTCVVLKQNAMKVYTLHCCNCFFLPYYAIQRYFGILRFYLQIKSPHMFVI